MPFGLHLDPRRLRLSLRYVLLAVMIVLWGIGVLEPLMSRQEAVSADLDNALRVAAERGRTIADRDAIVAAYERWTSEREASEPGQEDVTAVMRRLARGVRGDLRIMRMGPGTVGTAQEMRRIGGEIELRGDLESIVRYLHTLEFGADPLVVDHLGLQTVAGERDEFDARVAAFKLAP